MKKVTFEEYKEMTKGMHPVKTSMARGYVTRKPHNYRLVEEYKGRYGEGYKLFNACYYSTQYCFVTYIVR